MQYCTLGKNSGRSMEVGYFMFPVVGTFTSSVRHPRPPNMPTNRWKKHARMWAKKSLRQSNAKGKEGMAPQHALDPHTFLLRHLRC